MLRPERHRLTGLTLLGAAALLLGLVPGCAGDDKVVYSDEEPTEPMPVRSGAGGTAAEPPAATSQSDPSYVRSLLRDPARARERFDLVRRLAEGEAPMRPELVSLLKPLLENGDDGLRAYTVQALGRSGDAGALVAILRALGDEASVVRKAAIEVLAAAEGGEVNEKLGAMLRQTTNRARRAAAAALGRRLGAGFPGSPPDSGDPPEEHLRYLELAAVTGREDLFRQYIAPGRRGRNAGFMYRVTPVTDEEGPGAPRPQRFHIYAPELTVQRFTEEIAPGLMVDLQGDDPACSGWKRGKAECRCLTDSGQRYSVRLRKKGRKVTVAEVEWFPRPVR